MEDVAQKDPMEYVKDELDMQYLSHLDNSPNMQCLCHVDSLLGVQILALQMACQICSTWSAWKVH
jgi:hypothetical protein